METATKLIIKNRQEITGTKQKRKLAKQLRKFNAKLRQNCAGKVKIDKNKSNSKQTTVKSAHTYTHSHNQPNQLNQPPTNQTNKPFDLTT